MRYAHLFISALFVLVALAGSSCDSSQTQSGGYVPPPSTANEICKAQEKTAIDACYASQCSGCAGFSCLACYQYCVYDPRIAVDYLNCCQAQGCVQSISGFIKTSNGTAVPGAEVNFENELFTTTDTSGYYIFDSVNKAGTVTPSKYGYCFDPTSRTYSFNYEFYTNENYTARQTCYGISGTISSGNGTPLSGITVALAGPISGATVTASDGSYGFTALSGGSYTITPDYYGLSPISRNITIDGASLIGQDFIVTGRAISGRVAVIGTEPVPGVTMTLSGATNATTTTDTKGQYNFAGLAAGSYTVTPSTSCTSYSFDKPSISANIVNTDLGDQDFAITVAAYDVGGTITAGSTPLAGVMITRSGSATDMVMTDALGQYRFTAISDSVHNILTPSHTGYVFAPATREVVRCSVTIPAQDFSASDTWLREDKRFTDRSVVKALSDGGFLITGYGSAGPAIIKLDNSGNNVWETQFNNFDYIEFADLDMIAAGATVLIGRHYDVRTDAHHLLVLQIDSNGAVVWLKTYASRDVNLDSKIRSTPDGGFILAVNVNTADTGGDIWVLKLDASGNVTWQQTYGGAAWDGVAGIDVATDGSYAMVGSTVSFGAGASDVWIQKLDADGKVVWQQTVGGTNADTGWSIKATPDGGAVVAALTYSFTASTTAWVMKLTSSGAVSWQKTYTNATPHAINLTSDGGYIVSGKSSSDVWLMKLQGDGTPAWSKTYAVSQYINNARAVEELVGGGFIIASGNASYGQLIRVDANGDIALCDRDQAVATIANVTTITPVATTATVTTTTATASAMAVTPVTGTSSLPWARLCPAP